MRRTFLAIALAVVAGCGAAQTSLPPAASATKSQDVTMRVVIPVASTGAARRKLYISTSTQSIGLSVTTSSHTTVLTTTFDVGSGSSGCTTGTSAITCVETFALAPGSYTATITAYSGTGGTGSTLAQASNVAFTVSIGVANSIPFTLFGVPNSIVIAQSVLGAPADGSSHTLTLTISATDPAGNTIVPPGNYQTPIALSISGDTNAAVSLGTTSIAAPANSDGTTSVTVTYDASKALISALITATAGSASSSVRLNPLIYSPASSHTMYKGTSTTATITVSEANYSGPFTVASASPDATYACTPSNCTPSSAGGSVSITLTPAAIGKQNLYVSDSNNVTATIPFGVGGMQTFTGPTFSSYSAGIARDSAGKMWFTNGAKVFEFDPAACTTSCTVNTEATPSALSDVEQGPDGNAWALGSTKLYDYTACYPCTQKAYTVSGVNMYQAALGNDGDLWIMSSSTNQIVRSTSGGSTTTFSSPITGPNFVTSTSSGVMWFTSASGGVAYLTPSSCSSSCTITHLASSNGGNGITAMSDGTVWYTSGGKVYELSPSGCTSSCTQSAYTISALGNGSPIVAGTDGGIWVGDISKSVATLDRIDPSSCSSSSCSTVMSLSSSTTMATPYKLALDASGDIWGYSSSGYLVEVVLP